MFDEEAVRTYIKTFLDNAGYNIDQMDLALVSANKSAFDSGVFSGGIPEFIQVFHEEWNKKYPK